MSRFCALLLAALAAPHGALAQQTALASFFNVAEFPGLVSVPAAGFEHAVLDYDLDGASGRLLHFTDCQQVEAVSAQDVIPAQVPLLQLVSVNCQALRKYSLAGPATRSFLPARMTRALVRAFPAAMLPPANAEETRKRDQRTVAKHARGLRVRILDAHAARIATRTDEATYHIMARADLDHDGIEDLLVRSDWNARSGQGKGSELFLISKTSARAPVALTWRN